MIGFKPVFQKSTKYPCFDKKNAFVLVFYSVWLKIRFFKKTTWYRQPMQARIPHRSWSGLGIRSFFFSFVCRGVARAFRWNRLICSEYKAYLDKSPGTKNVQYNELCLTTSSLEIYARSFFAGKRRTDRELNPGPWVPKPDALPTMLTVRYLLVLTFIIWKMFVNGKVLASP